MKRSNMKPIDEFELKPEYDFSNGVRGRFYSPHKKATTIRLDDDVLLFFKKKSTIEKVGYQTLLNMALRDYISHRIK